MSTEESLKRAEELLAQLETTRAELETIAASDDPDKAIDVLARLAELGKQVEAELQHARQAAERDAAD